jgi:hypothetical protein
MALTAARTELNVSLVGEDETIRMLEDAKKRMGELEAKTRTLTGATKAQTDAAKAQQAAAVGVNDRLKGLAERAEGVVGGVDKVKGAFEKVVGVAGFLGMAIQGVVSATTFLIDIFDDSEEKAAALEAQMKRNKAETDRLKASTDALTTSMAQMQAATGQAAGVLASERAVLAEMRGDVELAEMERTGAAVEQRKLRGIELTQKETDAEKQRLSAVNEMIDAQARISSAETKREQLLGEARKAESQALSAFNKTELRERAQALRVEAGLVTANIATERARLDIAQRNRDAMDDGVRALREQQKINKEIIDQQLVNLGKPKADDKPDGGGGGGGRGGAAGPTPEEIAAQLKAEEEQRLRLRDLAQEFRLDELDEEKKHQRRMALAGLGDENLATLRSTRDRVAAELASLPQGAMAAAFAPLKTELEKRLTELDALAKQHAQMGIGEYFDQDQADKVLSSWEAEQKAIEQVNAALSALGETRAKAIEESEKMREAMFRAMPAEVVQAFATGLEQLGQMQAPVFEVVQESLAGLTAQMGKFKEGQTSLASAIVGSASAIAGAVAKKVGGVKAEAGVRAAFEVAMGIATAFTNPAESVGHFAAATAFGLLAGGVIKPSGGGASGGQKAPAAPAAATREGTMGGGGGTITNVYNLQTGIVDGQSTAMAFRRAEMTARNTGMASAGGW